MAIPRTTHDLVIRDGLVVDGTGAPARRGDLAVRDGRLSEVGTVTGRGEREISAAGLVVAPGFIGPHTHYDAQITWDRLASCSSWHGVTTVVMGNCGFTLAPCREEDRLTLMRMLTYVEGMPLGLSSTTNQNHVQPGLAADITIFDPDTIADHEPELVHDLPGGGPRLVPRASGIAWSFVNGRPVIQDGRMPESSETGGPGRLLRAS